MDEEVSGPISACCARREIAEPLIGVLGGFGFPSKYRFQPELEN